MPRPPADVAETFASIDAIAALTGFAPRTSLEEGIPRFVTWFKDRPKDVRRDRHAKPPTMPMPWGQRPVQ